MNTDHDYPLRLTCLILTSQISGNMQSGDSDSGVSVSDEDTYNHEHSHHQHSNKPKTDFFKRRELRRKLYNLKVK
jgi:hypothetical protein